MTITFPNTYPFPASSSAPARALILSLLLLVGITLLSILTRGKPEAPFIPVPPSAPDFPTTPEPPVIQKPDIVESPDVLLVPTLLSQPLLQEPPLRTFELPDLAAGPGGLGAGDVFSFRPASIASEMPTYWLDKMPGLIRMGSLKYPHELKKARVEGSVVLLILIDERGRVVVDQVLQASHRAFIQPAIEAAEASLFEPPLKDGKPVRSYYKLPFRFSLD